MQERGREEVWQWHNNGNETGPSHRACGDVTWYCPTCQFFFLLIFRDFYIWASSHFPGFVMWSPLFIPISDVTVEFQNLLWGGAWASLSRFCRDYSISPDDLWSRAHPQSFLKQDASLHNLPILRRRIEKKLTRLSVLLILTNRALPCSNG